MNKEPYIRFDERKPETYRDEFFVDLLIRFLSIVAVLFSVVLSIINKNFFFLKLGLLLPGVAYLLKILFSYNLQDKTGIIFLDYRQPLALGNFLFSLLRMKRYSREEVKVTGWYRRVPISYFE